MKKPLLILSITVTELISLIYLIILKYKQQGIELNDFKLSFVGNIFNLTIFALIVLFYLSFLFIQRNEEIIKLQMQLIFAVSRFILIFISDFFYVLKINEVLISLFGDYSDKVFVGVILFISQILQFMILYSILFLIFSKTKHPVIKSIGLSGVSFLFLIVLVLLGTYTVGNSEKDLKSIKKADIVVIMGAAVKGNREPSDIFMGRILQAYKLWKIKLTKRILTTGGGAKGEKSEALIAKKVLMSEGVPEKYIFMEDKSKSTFDQVMFIKSILTHNPKIEKIIVVSDQFHFLRIHFIAKFNDIKLFYSPSNIKLSTGKELWFRFRETISIILYCLFGI